MRQIINLCIFLLSTGTLFSPVAQGQDWINFTDGKTITDIKGEGDDVWISSFGGLVKYDRINNTSLFYNRSNGLPYNCVLDLAIDSAGNKWLALQHHGITKFDGTTFIHFTTANSGLPNDNITAITFDSINNVLWIGTYEEGLIKYDGTNWVVYDESNSPLQNGHGISTIAVDAAGNVWIGSKYQNASYGLMKFDGINWSVYSQIGPKIQSIVADSLFVYACEEQGFVWKYDGVSWILIPGLAHFSPNNYYYFFGNDQICLDQNNNLLVATEYGGLAMFDGTQWSYLNTGNSGIISDRIMSVGVDDGGNTWVIAKNYGFQCYDNITWWVPPITNSPFNTFYLSCIAQRSSGNYYIANRNYYLYEFDGSSWQTYTYNILSTFYYGIRSMIGNSSDLLYVGAGSTAPYAGFSIFDGTNWSLHSVFGFNQPEITTMAIDINNDLWFGGIRGGGLIKYDSTGYTQYIPSNSGLGHVIIQDIATDASGNIWLTNGDPFDQNGFDPWGLGLIKFDGTNWTTFDTTNSGISSNLITCVAVDNSGNIWCGTVDSGLTMYNGSTWTNYSTSNSPLVSNSIHNLAFDSGDTLWIGYTNNGLGKFDGVNWTDYNISNSPIGDNEIIDIMIDNADNKWILSYPSGYISVFKSYGSTLGVNNTDNLNTVISTTIAPNPFFNSTTITSSKKVHKGYLEIYNIYGQLVSAVPFIETNQVQIKREQMKFGIYFYTLFENNLPVANGKFVIVD